MNQANVQPFSAGRVFSAVTIFAIALTAISFTVSEFVKKGNHFQSVVPGSASGIRGQQLFYRSIGHGPQNPRPLEQERKSPLLSKSYTLEIDSSPTIELAEDFLRKLSRLRVQAYYTPLQKDGRVVYRIRTGIYRSKATADQASVKLLKEQNISTKVAKLQ